MVCEVLDRKFVRYVVFDVDPRKAIEGRNRGLPVFFGDVSRPEVLQSFNVGSSQLVVTAMGDRHTSNKAIVALRRLYPEIPILARAADLEHQRRLTSTMDVMALVPILPEDSLLLNLPFGGAVLKALGSPPEEVGAILEEVRTRAVALKQAGSAVEAEAWVPAGEGEVVVKMRGTHVGGGGAGAGATTTLFRDDKAPPKEAVTYETKKSKALRELGQPPASGNRAATSPAAPSPRPGSAVEGDAAGAGADLSDAAGKVGLVVDAALFGSGNGGDGDSAEAMPASDDAGGF